MIISVGETATTRMHTTTLTPQRSAVLQEGGPFQTTGVTNEVKWFVPPP